jgi:hypothetical protein
LFIIATYVLVFYALGCIPLVIAWRSWQLGSYLPAWCRVFTMVSLLLTSEGALCVPALILLFTTKHVLYNYVHAIVFPFGIVCPLLAVPLSLFSVGRTRNYTLFAASLLLVCNASILGVGE